MAHPDVDLHTYLRSTPEWRLPVPVPVYRYMQHIQDNAEASVRALLRRFAATHGEAAVAVDQLDTSSTLFLDTSSTLPRHFLDTS